ncbi:DnaJ-domain-containing protein [Pluteus cervinus]|uniref:DnaJ-domain-containing protein n=1 Tax=Pluteus cervinus TaxID=181527 RepID=A0ACD3BE02_9AGAR|nr:DnaJ-domain-containing protein [Pluteus cervinus]
MRLYFLLVVLTTLATFAFAWEKEDYEIFDLVGALEAAEGKGTSFYSWLNVPPTATTNEIAKAYRKMSMTLHPDKNPNVKGVHERFARLGVVSTILRNTESRERYDFWYKNGVPKWRGTGYYYSRFRPGLGTVLVFLVAITSFLQYIVQRMNYTKDLERIERFQREARVAAWGPKLVPVEGKRKVKVPLGPARFDEDGDMVASGRTVDMVVEGSNVYILDPSGTLEILDSSAALRPAMSRTWFISLVTSVFDKFLHRKQDVLDGVVEESENEGGSSTASEAQDGTPTANDVNGRAPATKAGGRRRKAVKSSKR